MLGRHHHVFHARVLGQPHPGVGVVLSGVELCGKGVIIRQRHPGLLRNEAGIRWNLPAFVFPGRHRINAPVDKHTEPRVVKPRQALIALLPCFMGIGVRRFLYGGCKNHISRTCGNRKHDRNNGPYSSFQDHTFLSPAWREVLQKRASSKEVKTVSIKGSI